MYISFKAWFDTCNKMSLSVKWYRCLDLATYTDLFTLKTRFLKKNFLKSYRKLLISPQDITVKGT